MMIIFWISVLVTGFRLHAGGGSQIRGAGSQIRLNLTSGHCWTIGYPHLDY